MRTIIPLDRTRKHDPSLNLGSPRNTKVAQPYVDGERLAPPNRPRSSTAATNLNVVGSAPIHDEPQPCNWPRMLMLVLMQLAVGIIVTERLLTSAFTLKSPEFDLLNWENVQFPMAMGALIFAVLGFGIDTIFGASQSEANVIFSRRWLIRERVALISFEAAVAADVLVLSQRADFAIPTWSVALFGYVAAATGVVWIASSAMVHMTTQRKLWSAIRVFRHFVWTTVMFGLTVGLVALNLARLDSTSFRSSPVGLLVCCLLLEAGAISTSMRLFGASSFMRRNIARDRLGRELTTNIRIVRLLSGPLSRLTRLRAGLGYLSGVLFPLLVASQPPLSQLWISQIHMNFQIGLIAAMALLRCAAEVLEGYLFFVTAIEDDLGTEGRLGAGQRSHYAMISLATLPARSVSLKSRPE